MTDVSALTDLPSPATTDYILSWRGTAPYRLSLGQVMHKDATLNTFLINKFGGQINLDGNFNSIGGGAAFYSSNWRNTQTGQGGWSITNNGGVFTIQTGSNPGAAGSVITDIAERLRIDAQGNIGHGTTGPSAEYELWRSKNNAATVMKVTNATTGASTQARYDLATGTGNSYAIVGLQDNAGAPYSFISRGSVVTTHYDDCNTHIWRNNSAATKLNLDNSSNLYPGVDNTTNALGLPSKRWTTVYAGTGTINTSDEREKKWRGSLSEAELKAAKRIANEIGVYQWLDAVEEKGENARFHIGVRAQRVFKILEECGLDWRRYACCCYDEWKDQFEPDIQVIKKIVKREKEKTTPTNLIAPDGSTLIKVEVEVEEIEVEEIIDTGKMRLITAAGDRYGVRPDQLAMFLIAAQEQRLAALEAALA